MKKFISFSLICTMLFALCACGEKQPEPTEPVTDEVTQLISDGNVSDGNVTDGITESDPVTETQQNGEPATLNAAFAENATIPSIEEYTFTAEETKNKANFVFEGETQSIKTCNKIITVNEDGITQVSVSFAEDGSGLTVYTLAADGEKYTTLARFDRDGRLVGIFNGSGAYSDYTYGDDNTCVLQAYDTDGALLDYRKYYYDDNEITQKVERGDGQEIYEIYNYSTDASGKTTSLRVENDTGYVLYDYTYNADGKLQSNRIEQNNMFYGIQVYTYDENGKRSSYTFRNDENAPHALDMTVNYNNVYDTDGTYLGTAEVDSVTGEVYIAVAYDYTVTEYPHYAAFLEDHFMNY